LAADRCSGSRKQGIRFARRLDVKSHESGSKADLPFIKKTGFAAPISPAAALAAPSHGPAREAMWDEIRRDFLPSKHGHDWDLARIVFDQLIDNLLANEEDPRVVGINFRRFTAARAKEDPQYIPAVQSWFKNNIWKKDYPPTFMETYAAEQQHQEAERRSQCENCYSTLTPQSADEGSLICRECQTIMDANCEEAVKAMQEG
jgi:hypothetical protein